MAKVKVGTFVRPVYDPWTGEDGWVLEPIKGKS